MHAPSEQVRSAERTCSDGKCARPSPGMRCKVVPLKTQDDPRPEPAAREAFGSCGKTQEARAPFFKRSGPGKREEMKKMTDRGAPNSVWRPSGRFCLKSLKKPWQKMRRCFFNFSLDWKAHRFDALSFGKRCVS